MVFDHVDCDGNNTTHSKYLSLILAHEEQLDDDRDSYYKAITRLIQLQEYLSTHDEEDVEKKIEDFQVIESSGKSSDQGLSMLQSGNLDVLTSANLRDERQSKIGKKHTLRSSFFGSGSSIPTIQSGMTMFIGGLGEGSN